MLVETYFFGSNGSFWQQENSPTISYADCDQNPQGIRQETTTDHCCESDHPVHQRALLSCLLHPAKCSGRLLNQGACSGRFLVACNSLSYCLCNLHFLPLLCCLSGGSDCLTSLITLLGLTALCVSLCVFVCVQVQLLCLFCNDGSRGW